MHASRNKSVETPHKSLHNRTHILPSTHIRPELRPPKRKRLHHHYVDGLRRHKHTDTRNANRSIVHTNPIPPHHGRTHIVLRQIRMVRFQAIVQNRNHHPFAGDAFAPRWDHVHVQAVAAILCVCVCSYNRKPNVCECDDMVITRCPQLSTYQVPHLRPFRIVERHPAVGRQRCARRSLAHKVAFLSRFGALLLRPMDAIVVGQAFVVLVGRLQRTSLHVTVMEVIVIVDDLFGGGERWNVDLVNWKKIYV